MSAELRVVEHLDGTRDPIVPGRVRQGDDAQADPVEYKRIMDPADTPRHGDRDGRTQDLLRMVGGHTRHWVQVPDIVKGSLVFASIWRYLGFRLLITCGAHQAVPVDQYEAARIEGASEWQQFRHITFPTIAPILGLRVTLSTGGSLVVSEYRRVGVAAAIA